MKRGSASQTARRPDVIESAARRAALVAEEGGKTPDGVKRLGLGAVRLHGEARRRVCHRRNNVRWQPAVDVNRMMLGGQIVAIVLLLVAGSVFGAVDSSGGLGRAIVRQHRDR